jgi:hypothetical protein
MPNLSAPKDIAASVIIVARAIPGHPKRKLSSWHAPGKAVFSQHSGICSFSTLQSRPNHTAASNGSRKIMTLNRKILPVMINLPAGPKRVYLKGDSPHLNNTNPLKNRSFFEN